MLKLGMINPVSTGRDERIHLCFLGMLPFPFSFSGFWGEEGTGKPDDDRPEDTESAGRTTSWKEAE